MPATVLITPVDDGPARPPGGQAAAVPVPPVRPSQLRHQVFRGTAAVAAGLLTPDQLRSSAWRRLRQDVYADAALAVDHRLHARGVALLAPPGAAFAGLTAVVLWGGHEFVMPATESREPGSTPTLARYPKWPPVWPRSTRPSRSVVHHPRQASLRPTRCCISRRSYSWTSQPWAWTPWRARRSGIICWN